ncbi:response regulator transcription factor [Burkholderia sp. WSM2230]|uniref:response regulator transcription factor n=1 Tax=Burkholderia sp. WSM2230 TaxID=944435 RepID=UPI0004724834|nr:response regulator transcription factor [Burkholderia sp. WSM2230]
MANKIRVILADDHDCVRVGVTRLLRATPDIEVVGEASDTPGLAKLLDSCNCDVIVTDIGMPGLDGGANSVSFLRRVLRGRAHPPVVVLTMIGRSHMLSGLLHLGVSAIVDKRDTTTHLIDAVRAAMAADVYLSEHVRMAMKITEAPPQLRDGILSAREWEIFQLYAQGLAVHEIADRLQRSSKTVSTQKRTAMRKLGLDTDSDLIDYARQIGLI